MSRIRTLKPEILEDEKAAALSDAAYRLFTSAVVLADDYGLLRGSPSWLRGQIWWSQPRITDAKVSEFVDELCATGMVRRYTVKGQTYLSITNWTKHQRIDNAGKARCPRPEEADFESAEIRRESPRDSASLGEIPLDPDPDRTPTRTPMALSSTSSPPAATSIEKQSEPVIAIPTTRNLEFLVTADDVAEWSAAYPGVDVPQALRNMRQWCLSNPKKLKTPSGVRKFVTNWLADDQNKGRCRRDGTGPPSGYVTKKGREVQASYLHGLHDPDIFPDGPPKDLPHGAG